jgi:uncharacterized protein YdiU (UPF0061 family)
MPVTDAYSPETLHLRLGDEFYDPVEAAAFPQHILRFRNDRAARTVGLEALTDAEWIAHFGRFEPLPGSLPQPLALRYHGHQFRSYNPDLGDGRGFLFAQLRDTGDGRLLDLGTKGSGQTPWSRRGDGRLTLKGGLREILATEMLEALGVETSKSFSLVETGEALIRGDEPSPTRSSVLVRLSHSHIRIGTFQRLAAQGDEASIRHLLAYVIDQYMPALADLPEERRPLAFLEEVCRRVARMGARYIAAGFVHGVLNSDNINVTGESFDYGPWRFVPTFDPNFTAAYFDETGLYAFGRQPNAMFWNLARLAECLLSLASQEDLEQAMAVFEPTLQQEFSAAILDRLGLAPVDDVAHAELSRTLVEFLMTSKAPFEQMFFDWYGGRASQERAARSPVAEFYKGEAFEPLFAAMMRFTPRPDLRLDHAYFGRERPCTLLIEEVEALWAPIADADDWSAYEAKIAAIGEMREAYGR